MHNILLSKIIMKKLLTLILTILWIWFSFCSADCSELLSYPSIWLSSNWNVPSYVWFQIFNTWFDFSVSSFSVYFAQNRNYSYSPVSVYGCYWNSYNPSSDLLSNCTLLSFSYENIFASSKYKSFITLDSDFIIPSWNEYFYFLIYLDSSSSYKSPFSSSVYSLDNNLSFLTPDSSSYYSPAVCSSICYSLVTPITSPKLKINYWNTSYEYELDDNLSIYLKSSVTQSWNTFIYAWSTWINLYFNNTSQFYNKSRLYVWNVMFYYFDNVFTPLC